MNKLWIVPRIHIYLHAPLKKKKVFGGCVCLFCFVFKLGNYRRHYLTSRSLPGIHKAAIHSESNASRVSLPKLWDLTWSSCYFSMDNPDFLKISGKWSHSYIALPLRRKTLHLMWWQSRTDFHGGIILSKLFWVL